MHGEFFPLHLPSVIMPPGLLDKADLTHHAISLGPTVPCTAPFMRRVEWWLPLAPIWPCSLYGTWVFLAVMLPRFPLQAYSESFFCFFKRTSQSTPSRDSSKKLLLSIFLVLTKYTSGHENFKWHCYNSYRTFAFSFKKPWHFKVKSLCQHVVFGKSLVTRIKSKMQAN